MKERTEFSAPKEYFRIRKQNRFQNKNVAPIRGIPTTFGLRDGELTTTESGEGESGERENSLSLTAHVPF